MSPSYLCYYFTRDESIDTHNLAENQKRVRDLRFLPQSQEPRFSSLMTNWSLKDYEEARTGSELECEFLFLSCLDSIHILAPTQQPQYTLPWELSNFNINLGYFASKL